MNFSMYGSNNDFIRMRDLFIFDTCPGGDWSRSNQNVRLLEFLYGLEQTQGENIRTNRNSRIL
ncbi:hypothetical protein BM613_05040 [Sulfoacidibacillus thermotolerans]|uniref:Uncharacterized protein n=1 Tax=Sulfoacidibacillus thermotolerans TaxID=1765684 RepID=A0A2U3D9V5_SULT2|nr:hypothetical protein BM613_05040 [Sulfoacidibacillus thermotolerans]